MKVDVPYGKTEQKLVIPNNLNVTQLQPKFEVEGIENIDENKILTKAINKPLGTEKLMKIAKNKAHAVIVCDDYTRKLATEKMLDVVVPILEHANVAKITLLMGTGTHRPPTDVETKAIMGKYYEKLSCIAHNSEAKDLIKVGTTSRGNEVFLNPIYVKADVKISFNDVSMHYYGGLGGGRKSIVPGIAGKDTIQFNHSYLLHEKAAVGNLEGNPVSEDMVEAANIVSPDFSVSVIQHGKKIIHAAAGTLNKAFEVMADQCKQYFLKEATQRFDLLVVGAGGLPKDINIYQATKAIEHTKSLVNTKGSIVIFVAQAKDGIGNKKFEESLKRFDTLEEISAKIKTNFIMGEHKTYYWYQALKRARHLLVTDMNSTDVKTLLKVDKFDSLQQAFDTALNELGTDIDIGIIPSAAEFAFHKGF